MKHQKRFKKLLAFLACVFILLFSFIPLVLALDFIVDLTIVDTSFVDAVYTLRDDQTLNSYQNGDSIVFTDLTTLKVKAVLDQTGIDQGFNGFFVTLRSSVSNANVINTFVAQGDLTAVATANGYFYFIPDNTYFTWAVSCDGYYLSFTPVYYSLNDNSGYGGYSAGYDAGFMAGKQSMYGQISKLQTEYDQLEQAYQNQSNINVDQIAKDNYEKGLAEAGANQVFVQDVVKTGINGFSSILGNLLSIEVLGIKLYAIVLVICLIPFSIFILKLVTHR